MKSPLAVHAPIVRRLYWPGGIYFYIDSMFKH
nr:MAG TPA: hypothetical protein [Caudoviricetes sp.]